uniref:Uncharacterized protein n=1 Tax=Denticeps clupeoides TaxID=299321 RepID=A0AAY4BM49_9TELE
MMWAEHRRAIHITQAELLCKNGCGFYGNAAWQGHCSKCWRDRTSDDMLSAILFGGPRVSSVRFPPRSDAAAPPSVSKEKKSEEKSRRSTSCPSPVGMPEEQVEQMMEHMEKLVMTRLHKWVFCHDSCDDEQKDLALQRRIRSLKWVTPQMLRVPFTDRGPEDADPYLPAITAIIEMDAKRAPQDKLCCVSKCSRNIFQAVGSCKSEPACADDFLSALIYVVLCANPPRLHSNMQYVARFGLPHSCAVAFIEKLDAAALGLSPDEFRGFMQGGRGHRRQEHVMEQARSLQAQLRSWAESTQTRADEVASGGRRDIRINDVINTVHQPQSLLQTGTD